ncbi:hypothetical protein H0H87_012758, partial [Tephrocybe sp. NHM501043]
MVFAFALSSIRRIFSQFNTSMANASSVTLFNQGSRLGLCASEDGDESEKSFSVSMNSADVDSKQEIASTPPMTDTRTRVETAAMVEKRILYDE